MDVLRHLLDFGYLYNNGGVDTVVYALMALVGTMLFVIRLGLSLLLGLDGDMDLDGTEIEHGTGFSIISVQSVMAFFMGAGWAGLAARLEWDQHPGMAALISGGFGMLLMVLSSLLMLAAMKLRHEVTYDMNDAVGRVGTVYMTVPEKGAGLGQVRVSISGRSMTVDAVSSGGKIDAFKDVRVDMVRGDKVLVVSPAGD